MAYLIESSILMRLANKSDADYATARNAIYALHSRGESLRSAPQSYVEFRNSATRSTDVNGLGLAPSLVGRDLSCPRYNARFDLQRPAFRALRKIWAGLDRRQPARSSVSFYYAV